MKHGAMLLLLAAVAAAQTSSIEGFVQDQSGARIPGAQVVITRATQRWTTVTATDGSYRIGGLADGEYRGEYTFAGFNRFVAQIIKVSGAAEFNATLSASGVTEQVNISAAAQMLQPSRATQSATLGTRELVELPSASRNYTHLIVAEAGVSAPLPDRTGRGLELVTTPGTATEDGSQSLNPSVNGARPSNNSVTINGQDTTNMLNANGGLGSNLNVPLDAVEMIEVQTALYSATTGRNGGGNIQILTKSGTNELHGSASHYLQNELFNGNEFFLNRAGTARPQFRRNETALSLGGPIWKNRTFFFASVQRTDFVSGYARNALAATGLPAGLTDVRTRDSIAQVANQYLREGAADNPQFLANFLTAIRRFPADQIDRLTNKFFQNPAALTLRTLTAADIHPVAVNVLNQKRAGKLLIPTPSANMPVLAGNGTYGRESLLQQVIPTTYNSWTGSGTVEHNFSEKNRLRLNYIKGAQIVEEAFGWADASPSPTQGDNSSWTGSLSDHHTFSPNWLNELRGGFFELYNTRISLLRDITNSSLGIRNPLEEQLGGLAALMPTIDINTQRNSGGIGNAWDFFDRQRVINIADIVTYTTGKHTVQFGGEYRRPTVKGEYMSRTNGDLDYDNWVFFFTGHGAAGGGSDLDQGDTRRHFKMSDVGFFAQDDWRIRRGLTINAGLRWDYYGNPSEAEGKIGNYYLPETAARLGVKPGFQVPGNSVIFDPNFQPIMVGLVVEPNVPWSVSGINKAMNDSTLRSDYNNFAPRIGFAWQPARFQNLVIRGGYGMFFERPSAAFKTDLQRTAPFFMYQNVPAPVDMADPYPLINVNPFELPLNVTIARNAQGVPNWRRFDGSAFPAQSPFSSKSYTFIDPFITTPYVQQWTMNLQFEPVTGNLVDVRYVGSRGVGLLAKLNIAQPRDPRVSPVNGFTDILDSAGRLINPDFFVPQQFLGLNRSSGFQVRSNWAHSTYHALQFSLRRRYSRGLSWNLAYTWSKTIDNISSDTGLVEHDSYNARGNRGPSDFDRRHRLTAAWTAEIPTPYGSGVAGSVLKGWSVNGMLTMQSGAPFSITGASTANATFAQPARVRMDWAPGVTLAGARGSGDPQSRLDSYFNTAAFMNSDDRWGNSGRNILAGPSQTQVDFSLAKALRFSERIRADLRWELYNATNTPVFRNPSSTFAAAGPGNAGRITETIGGPRTMQGALRFRF